VIFCFAFFQCTLYPLTELFTSYLIREGDKIPVSILLSYGTAEEAQVCYSVLKNFKLTGTALQNYCMEFD
jgi:hypothetical protein